MNIKKHIKREYFIAQTSYAPKWKRWKPRNFHYKILLSKKWNATSTEKKKENTTDWKIVWKFIFHSPIHHWNEFYGTWFFFSSLYCWAPLLPHICLVVAEKGFLVTDEMVYGFRSLAVASPPTRPSALRCIFLLFSFFSFFLVALLFYYYSAEYLFV